MSEPNAPLAVTDAHALIWVIGDKRKRLGKRAKRFITDRSYESLERDRVGALVNLQTECWEW